MLTERQIQEAILAKMDLINTSCNQRYRDTGDGFIRGLLFALTGEDKPVNEDSSSAEILSRAGINHWREGDRVCWQLS